MLRVPGGASSVWIDGGCVLFSFVRGMLLWR